MVSVMFSCVCMDMNIFSLKCSSILVSMFVVNVIGICCISCVKIFEKLVIMFSIVVSMKVLIVLL